MLEIQGQKSVSVSKLNIREYGHEFHILVICVSYFHN